MIQRLTQIQLASFTNTRLQNSGTTTSQCKMTSQWAWKSHLPTIVNVGLLLQHFFWIIEIIHVSGIRVASAVLTDLWYSQVQIFTYYILNNYTHTRGGYQCNQLKREILWVWENPSRKGKYTMGCPKWEFINWFYTSCISKQLPWTKWSSHERRIMSSNPHNNSIQ